MTPYILVGIGIVAGILIGGAIAFYIAANILGKLLSVFWSRF